eukprot:gene9518-biopygen10740
MWVLGFLSEEAGLVRNLADAPGLMLTKSEISTIPTLARGVARARLPGRTWEIRIGGSRQLYNTKLAGYTEDWTSLLIAISGNPPHKATKAPDRPRSPAPPRVPWDRQFSPSAPF